MILLRHPFEFRDLKEKARIRSREKGSYGLTIMACASGSILSRILLGDSNQSELTLDVLGLIGSIELAVQI